MSCIPKQIKITNEIILELFKISHKKQFFESIHNLKEDDQFRYKLQKRFQTIEKVEKMLYCAIEDKLKATGAPDFFIIYKGQVAGMFEFHPLTDEDYVEIGYWIYASFRRKGILSTIIPVMIDFTKKYFDKSKILATTPIDNIPSQSLLAKMNFVQTGKVIEFTDSKTGLVSLEFEYFYYLDNL